MKYIIHGDNTASIKEYIEQKLDRLDKYFNNADITATIVIANNTKDHFNTSFFISLLSFRANEVVISPKSKLTQGIYAPYINPPNIPITIEHFLSLTNSIELFLCSKGK